MGQIIDNLNNINIPKPSDTFGSNGKTAFSENNTTGVSGPDKDSLLGYKFTREKSNGYLDNTTMKNFEEYLQNRQEKARQAGQDAASEEAKEKENEKEVARNLSSDEIKRLKLMGIDIEGASMSDLLGMVNTMRHNAHKEEQEELMAGIALSKGDTDGMTMIGGAVKAGGVKLDVDASDMMTAQAKAESIEEKSAAQAKEDFINKQTEADIGSRVSDDNAQAVNMAEDFSFNNNEIIYLLHNDMPVNEDNLYKAHFSGTKIDNTVLDEKVFEEMKPQIENVIEQAGLSVDDETLAAAKLLINNDIPITTDNIRRYDELKEYVGKDASEVLADISNREVIDPAEKLLKDINNISPDLVYDMAKDGKEVTIAKAVRELGLDINKKESPAKTENGRLFETDESLSTYEKDLEAGTLDPKAVTARRQMEEIRLSMTMEASVRRTSVDVNVDTRELSKFVNMLRDVERRMLGDAFKNAGVEPSNENLLTYNEFMGKVSDIAGAPMEILAAPLANEGTFTVSSLHVRAMTVSAEYNIRTAGTQDAGTKIETVQTTGQAALTGQVGRDVQQARFETVARSYESVGTAPRYDMGDSISKAFNNVRDILESMDMPVNNETERAVKILGYNRIEITEENISEVINYDRQVNELIDNLYPEAALGLIKDHINPMDVSIEDLNKTIRDKRYNEGVTEAEDFASYLRDMERNGEVSAEERESYIGIYRMMNKLAKSGDREAGWLFANSSRLTVRNLLSAMRSHKNAGVDVSVDDAFGALSDINVKGSRIDAQIESAFKERPDVAPVDAEDIAGDIKRFEELGEEVSEFIRENNIEFSMVNAFAVDSMLNTPGGIYQLVSELLANMNFSADETGNIVDEETEHMTDSMSGEDIDIDITAFEMDSILESLRGSEEMSLKYDDLRNQITEMMYKMGAGGRIGSLDIASFKTINAGFNIMSSMAKRENFQIPVKTGDGINVINLSVVHNEENRGSINVNMKTASLGNISCDIRVSEERTLFGHIISDTSDGNNTLMGLMSRFEEVMSGEGFEAGGISMGRIGDAISGISENTIGTAAYNGEQLISERTLYEAAVSLVRGLVGISG